MKKGSKELVSAYVEHFMYHYRSVTAPIRKGAQNGQREKFLQH